MRTATPIVPSLNSACDTSTKGYQAVAAGRRIRRGGVAPALSDEEVITIEICGEYLKGGTDKDIVDYVPAHYQAFFPHLRDRSRFARQATSL